MSIEDSIAAVRSWALDAEDENSGGGEDQQVAAEHDAVTTIGALDAAARDRGYSVVEEPISRDQLYIADEVFVCGTAAEVVGLREIDFRKIGNGKTGPVTRALQTEFDKLTSGRHPRSAAWLSPVPAFDAALAGV